MENTFDPIKPLLEKLKTYGRTSYKLYKLQTVSKTTEVISVFLSRLSVVIVFCLFFVFASVGLALWLGDLLDKLYLGFLCVAIFYVLLGVLLNYFLHNFIKRKIGNAIISEILNNKNEDNNKH